MIFKGGLAIDPIISKYILDNGQAVVDWQNKSNLIGKIKIKIEDYLIDELKRKYDIPLTFDEID